MKIHAQTWIMACAAVSSVVLARVDPWADDRVVAPITSVRSGARRLLPQLGEVDVAQATIVLSPPTGAAVTLSPAPAGGHELREGDVVLGPADPEAVEGLWSSLRMATTLRAVTEGVDAGLGQGGALTLSWPGQQRHLVLGVDTVDDVGVYGTVQGGAIGTEGLWVLERELSMLLAQSPQAWLARRAVVVQTAHIESAVFADGPALQRDATGLWRARAALLEPHAIRTRIERIVSARLDPLLKPERAGPLQPWLTLGSIDGTQFALSTAGPCPGRDGRVVIHRGPGLVGCIQGSLVQPWVLGPLVHPQLAPHPYGDVLSIAQRVPEPRTLARHGGGWRLQETLAGREVQTDVDETAVYRWYGGLHEAEVEAVEAAVPTGPPEVTYELSMAQAVTMTLSCWPVGEAGTRLCRRDGGPMLAVRGVLAVPPLSPELFTDRRVVAGMSIDDARAVEILAGEGAPRGARGRRQSAHFDLGVWRLDAPPHPDGDDALDTTQLDALLAAVAGLRAERWTEPPQGAPLRTIRIDAAARTGLEEATELSLYDGCVVVARGGRPAVISDSACRRLGADLLFADPLLAWLDRAEGVELTAAGGAPVPLSRAGQGWVPADGGSMGPLSDVLQRLRGWRANAVLRGDPQGPWRWSLRIRPRRGAAFVVHVGERWAQIAGADWRYAGPPIFDAPASGG